MAKKYLKTADGSLIVDPKTGGLYTINIDSKEITQNGEYRASEDRLDGYSNIVVNVPTSNIDKFEISSENEMSVLTDKINIGNTYLYSGETTEDFTNGSVYIVDEDDPNSLLVEKNIGKVFLINNEFYLVEETEPDNLLTKENVGNVYRIDNKIYQVEEV